jgi:hypothetical protein
MIKTDVATRVGTVWSVAGVNILAASKMADRIEEAYGRGWQTSLTFFGALLGLIIVFGLVVDREEAKSRHIT